MKMNPKERKEQAFTLIELLVVIAILAVLAVAVTLILNPAELIRQGRDSTRLSDLAIINRALGLYQTDQIAKWMGTSTVVYTSLPDTTSTCASYGLPSLPSGWEYNCVQSSSSTRVDGTGWIPVDFTSMSFSSPLSRLPLDPVNEATSSQYYTYVTGGSWELTAMIEAEVNRIGGESDKVSNDGGDSYSLYEVGSDVELNPINDQGLVGHWQFNEGSGSSVYDSSGTGNGGSINGATYTTDAREGDYALEFDGVNDYVDLGTMAPENNLSLSAWIKLDDVTSADKVVVDVGNYLLYYNDGVELRFYARNGEGISYTWSPDKDKYYHIAYSGEGKLYIDGLSVGTGIVFTGDYRDNSVSIGSKGGVYGFFNGTIDEVRIYNRALSAAEIEAMYNSY